LNGVSAAGQVAGGYIIVSLSGTWVLPVATAGVHATDTIWLFGGIVFLLSTIPIFIAREVDPDQPSRRCDCHRSAGRVLKPKSRQQLPARTVLRSLPDLNYLAQDIAVVGNSEGAGVLLNEPTSQAH
jgi:hypothetical protein